MIVLALLQLAFGMVAPSPTASQQVRVTVTIQPSSISAGDSALLSWKVEGASQVYVSSLGLSERMATRWVRPLSTTEYIVVAQADTMLRVGSARVEVIEGSKGDDDYPSPADFKDALSFRAPNSRPFPSFLAEVHGVLQNQFQTIVQPPRLTGNDYSYLTSRVIRAGLSLPADRRIAERRSAYIVTIGQPLPGADSIGYRVQVLIEYRRQGESRWRSESATSLYQKEANAVSAAINRSRR